MKKKIKQAGKADNKYRKADKKLRRLRALSLFANIGVAEAYLKEIGIDVVVANEYVEKRAKLYQAIYPDCDMICGDITDSTIFNTILKRAKEEEIDIVMATPPCQGMSTAGKQKAFDPRNDLFIYALDIIKKIKPSFIFFENVPAFMTTKVNYRGNEKLIPDVINEEIGSHYNLSFSVVNTQDYSVPQMRERMIMLGSRSDLGVIWKMPEKSKEKVTLREAIGWIPVIDPFIRDIPEEEFKKMFPLYDQRKEEALRISPWNEPTSHVLRNVVVMQHTPTGKSAFQNEDKWLPRKKNGDVVRGFKNTYKRQEWDRPGFTIAMDNIEISSQNNVHPGRLDYINEQGEEIYTDSRAMTTFELMCIMSLPRNWPVPIQTDSKFLRKVIGEGVPSLFVKKIFEVIPNEAE